MQPKSVITCMALLVVFFASATRGQQTGTEEFELRGTVINSATGEPVSGALVQLNVEGFAQFTGTDGTFVFSKLPRGTYIAIPRKPGFYSEQEINPWGIGKDSLIEIPTDAKLVVKLVPEAIIYGELKNEIGEPVEGMTVRALHWQAVDGRKQLQSAGDTVTDDEGKFRITELRPGGYQLAFLPASQGGWTASDKLLRKNHTAQGYGAEFYPGVAEAASATEIKLRAGSKFHVTQILSRERLYEVAGVVRGANPANGLNVSLVNAAGDAMQRTVRLDPKTGEFQIPGIPVGSYWLTATSFEVVQSGGKNLSTTQLRAMLPIHLKSDITGLVLTLGRGISVDVRVDDEVPAEAAGSGPRVVNVQFNSKEFSQYSVGAQVPAEPQEGEQSASRVDGVLPGTYTVEAFPYHPGYVASMRCGDTDLLRDELTVGEGTALPPIEIKVKNDGAQLSVTTVENGQPSAAGVVVYSQEHPRRSLLMQSNESGEVSMGGLAPGSIRWSR